MIKQCTWPWCKEVLGWCPCLDLKADEKPCYCYHLWYNPFLSCFHSDLSPWFNQVLVQTILKTTVLFHFCFSIDHLHNGDRFKYSLCASSAAAEAILKWGANLGGSGCMTPREILKFRAFETARNASFLLKSLQTAFNFWINLMVLNHTVSMQKFWFCYITVYDLFCIQIYNELQKIYVQK